VISWPSNRSPRLPAGFVAGTRSVISAMQSVGTGLAAWLDLAARCWLGQAFLARAAVTTMIHARLAMAGSGHWVDTFNDVINSPLGFAVQTACPLLLIFGLLSRPAALLLLIQALVLHSEEPSLDIYPFWGVLLGWFIVLGPGPLSLDALLGRGLDSSAVPAIEPLGAAFAWVSRTLGPWYWLFLRVWVATAPLSVALAGSCLSPDMRPGAIAPWLASVPNMVMAIAPGPSLILAVMLALGLGTRLAALILLAMIPIGQVGMSFDDRLYWTLLLALLGLRGPGPFALDQLLDRGLAWLDRRTLVGDTGLPHVVIVGGGFGGVATARGLVRARCRVTLVDQRNYHLFQPLLYQVATAGLSPADVATPIRSLFRTQPNVRVLMANVRGVETERREVILDRGPLAYDYLVLAMGSRTQLLRPG
jgi:uncharacterized membrane protein YphA (DoxX/SURF4 family)